MSLGENIKTIRLEKQMKQSDLADKAHISRVSIGNYERGDREPTASILKKIADALEVSPSELLFGVADRVKKLETFSDYLKSIGYKVLNEPSKGHMEDVVDEGGNVISQTPSTDEYDTILLKQNIKATFTQEEFEALQKQNKANIDGAILLQSEKNKQTKNKEPLSAATENGSNDENTHK